MKEYAFGLAVLLSAATLPAAAQSYISPDGQRSLAVDTTLGVATYESANGTLVISATGEGGFQIGSFTLEAQEVTKTSKGYRMHLVYGQNGKTAEDDVTVNEGQWRAAHHDQIAKEFARFNATTDGQLLQEARQFIASYVMPDSFLTTKTVTPKFQTASCVMNFLSEVGAMAGYIAGCTPGTCGPAQAACCLAGATNLANTTYTVATSTACVLRI